MCDVPSFFQPTTTTPKSLRQRPRHVAQRQPITIRCQTTPTTGRTTSPQAYKRTQRPPKPPSNDNRPPRRKMGTNAHKRHQPPRPTNDDGRPQTLTTTPTPPHSINNSHHDPQATSVAHPHQLPNPQATTERPPTAQESRPVKRSAHPSHSRTTKASANADNGHHTRSKTATTARKRRTRPTSNDDKW